AWRPTGRLHGDRNHFRDFGASADVIWPVATAFMTSDITTAASRAVLTGGNGNVWTKHAFARSAHRADQSATARSVRSANFLASTMQWTRGALFDRRMHSNYGRARSRRPLTRCFDGKSIASLISSLRLVFVSSYTELFQLAMYRLLQNV